MICQTLYWGHIKQNILTSSTIGIMEINNEDKDFQGHYRR
jgi:hypothetical protein